jgi:hypothetical protein
VVEDDPTNPKDDGGGSLAWPVAPLLEGVSVIPNRDSVKIVLPVVGDAQDYRVFAIPQGVAVETDASGHETGARHHDLLRGLPSAQRARRGPELLRQVEVAGLAAETRLVVEAIDTPCPFTGVLGKVSTRTWTRTTHARGRPIAAPSRSSPRPRSSRPTAA